MLSRLCIELLSLKKNSLGLLRLTALLAMTKKDMPRNNIGVKVLNFDFSLMYPYKV